MEIQPEGGSATYKLTSTVMLTMKVQRGDAGNVDLSGSLTRQVSSIHTKIAANSLLLQISNLVLLLDRKEIACHSCQHSYCEHG